jgi:hypothetical protein
MDFVVPLRKLPYTNWNIWLIVKIVVETNRLLYLLALPIAGVPLQI